MHIFSKSNFKTCRLEGIGEQERNFGRGKFVIYENFPSLKWWERRKEIS